MAVVDEAGAIPVRRVGKDWHVLLVTAKEDPSVWIFPKGHLEPGETAPDAALREAREEAGIRGRLIGLAGTLTFRQASDTMRVKYFLVETSDPGTAEAGRQIAWLPYETALARVSFEDSRSLLRESWALLQQDHSLRFSPDATRDRK